MYINDAKILDLIRESGLVTKTDFASALKKAAEKNQSVGDVLVSLGKLTEKDWINMQAQALGIPFVSLKGVKIDPTVLTLIPEPVARNSNIIAYKKSDDTIEVAMLDVANLPVIDFIKKKIGLRILPRLTDSESLKSSLAQYKKSLQADFEDIIKNAKTAGGFSVRLPLSDRN